VGKTIHQKSPVSRRLREARIRKGVSQKQLGILAGIDQFSASARINQYEQDKHVPDFSIAKRLAKVLGISVTYLYTEDDQLADIIRIFSGLSSNKKKLIYRTILKEDAEYSREE
jgi:transcriptional regulator with XRE-family HTH domain